MRLWHKDLIPYLPRQQLLAQWRECCAICSNWANKGTPNHLLVNKVMDYSKCEFHNFVGFVLSEFAIRKYVVSEKSFINFRENYDKIPNRHSHNNNIFENWHNERYLLQCLANLSEKYDCGGISENEWQKIKVAFPEQIKIIYGGWERMVRILFFPNFDLNSHELEYGVQRDDYGINIETKVKTKTGERILVRLNVELFEE